MFKGLLKVLYLVASAAADDKATSPGKCIANQAASLITKGFVGSATQFRNILASIVMPYNDTVSGEKEITVIGVRTSPVGDADYAGLPIGSIAIMHTVSAKVTTAVTLYMKTGTGANDWATICTPSASSSQVRTAAWKEIEVRGSNSGTGDYRGVYANISVTHASAGSGDALRGYAVTTGGANALRGAHLTAEIGAAGSVTGLATGATCQLTTVAGLTLSAGTVSALSLVSDLSSAVSSMTSASFIRLSENQSNKIPFFLDIDASATGCIGPNTANTAAKTVKIKIAGTTYYLQAYSAAS